MLDKSFKNSMLHNCCFKSEQQRPPHFYLNFKKMHKNSKMTIAA